MNKIPLIVQREYITRVRNKTFLLSTFLLPIVMLLFIFGTAYFAVSSKKKNVKVAVANAPELFSANLGNGGGKISMDMVTGVDSLNFEAKGYDALLDLKKDTGVKTFNIYSKKQLGLETDENISDLLNKAYETYQLQQLGIRKSKLDSVNKQSKDVYNINNRVISKSGSSEQVNAGLNYAIGMGSGLLIYITMFIFGAMVMRGVMEEKTNRIAEVMVSSVKPFQLMMGKILGIAAVGLTQLLLWIVLIIGLFSLAGLLLPHEIVQQAGEANKNMPVGGANMMAANFEHMKSVMFDHVNWFKIITCFIFYFLGGYLFYASLFAAIGSVINEDPQEAQSLMLPITMPIIFGFIILSTNLETPDSPAMVWASMIPFTSPIVMMGRIPSGVPFWQLAISIGLLVGGFVGTTWLAGKIYRTGILMYGKKATWKTMFTWAFKKS